MKDWKKVKLGSLLTESKIVSENPNTDKRLRVRLNMLGVEKRPKTNDKEGATKYYIRKAGQFIYGKQNLHKGAFGIIPEELDDFESSSDIPAFDVDESCYPEWIYYFFKKGNFYSKLESLAKGVGSKRINPNQIFELDIFLPSKEKQEEFLNKIYELETKHQAVLKEVERQKKLIVRLQQSILQNAIRGELSKKWRQQNPNVLDAEKLLADITKEKENLIKGNKIKPEKMFSTISKDSIPFEIPTSWVWCRMQDICINISSGSTPPKSEFGNQGIPYLKVYNIRKQKIDFEYTPQFINQDYHLKKLKRSILEPGDIVINIVGPPLGKVAIIPDDFKEWNCNQAIAFFKPIRSQLNHWVYTYLLSEDYLKRIEVVGTAGQDNISISKCKNIEIPLPTEEEQEVIFTRVQKLLGLCEKYIIVIENNKILTEQLLQSNLVKILGEENTIPEQLTESIQYDFVRELKYDNKTTFMELVDLLKKHGELHAEDLWKMSKHYDNKNIGESIDKFYTDLKKKIEVDKTVKEVINKKGYLELV